MNNVCVFVCVFTLNSWCCLHRESLNKLALIWKVHVWALRHQGLSFWPGLDLSHPTRCMQFWTPNSWTPSKQHKSSHAEAAAWAVLTVRIPAGRTVQTLHAIRAAFPYMHIWMHYLSKQAYLQKFHLGKARSIHHLRFVLHSWLLWYGIDRQRLCHDICLILG